MTDTRTGAIPTETATATETPREHPDTLFVEAESSGGEGTADAPFGSVQAALERAGPGDTIQVAPGTYDDKLTTVRSGTAAEPITITGPPDAVLHGNPSDYGVIRIHHSHIHLTGLTVEGLLEPKPQDLFAYVDGQLIQTRPPTSSDDYLTDIVIAPHRIGYSRKSLIGLERTVNAEIGPLKVTGLVGAEYVVGDERDHNGEILYIGTSPSNLGKDWHPWTEFDETSDVHIHHIDNSEGHAHAEVVDLKPGTHDIVVEYVTDRNGGRVTDDSTPNALSHNGHHNVVRWCDLGDAPMLVEFDADYPEWSYANSLYENHLHDYDEESIGFEDMDAVGLDDQAVLCGNWIEGVERGAHPVVGDCPASVPDGAGIGHDASAPPGS